MKVIDLSKQLSDGMRVYPGDPRVKMNVVHTVEEHGWELREMSMGTHSGTHVDAFSHMHKGEASLDDIPLERFFGPAQVVEKDGEWPLNIGLFFTNPIDESDAEKILKHQPSFVGGALSEELERILLANDIITYTDLINLEKIPYGKTFMFYGLPLKIKEGDGSPVRAIAILDNELVE